MFTCLILICNLNAAESGDWAGDTIWKKLSSDRKFMRNFFDNSIYKFPSNTTTDTGLGRVIFLSFMRAFPVTLDRLIENNSGLDHPLEGVIICALPYSDDISRAGGKDDITHHVSVTVYMYIPCPLYISICQLNLRPYVLAYMSRMNVYYSNL